MFGWFRGEHLQMPNCTCKISIYSQNGAKMPYRKYKNDAGYDLAINEDIVLMPGELRVVGSGLSIAEISNKAIFGMIKSRSSMFIKGIMCEGIIDSGYRGEIKLLIKNLSNDILNIEKGARVAQIIFLSYNEVKIDESKDIKNTDRLSGGLGSTGIY